MVTVKRSKIRDAFLGTALVVVGAVAALYSLAVGQYFAAEIVDYRIGQEINRVSDMGKIERGLAHLKSNVKVVEGIKAP